MFVRKISKSSCSFVVWILEVVIVLGFVSFVVWRSVVPKSSEYTITNIYIPALEKVQNSSTFDNQTQAIRNTSIIVNLEMSNPNNGIAVYYEEINVTLCYNDSVIGMKAIPGFYQGHKKTALRELLMNGHDEHFWKEINGGNWTGVLGVHLETFVRYKIFKFKTRHHGIKLEANVVIGLNGRISGKKSIKLHTKA